MEFTVCLPAPPVHWMHLSSHNSISVGIQDYYRFRLGPGIGLVSLLSCIFFIFSIFFSVIVVGIETILLATCALCENENDNLCSAQTMWKDYRNKCERDFFFFLPDTIKMTLSPWWTKDVKTIEKLERKIPVCIMTTKMETKYIHRPQYSNCNFLVIAGEHRISLVHDDEFKLHGARAATDFIIVMCKTDTSIWRSLSFSFSHTHSDLIWAKTIRVQYD